MNLNFTQSAFLSSFLIVLGVQGMLAKPVPHNTAEKVAKNYYARHSMIPVQSLHLAYTEMSDQQVPEYFVFNVNQSDGFVIVSAEDAGSPIIGYSTKGSYVIPTKESNIGACHSCRCQGDR
jgi:hypothetical protein